MYRRKGLKWNINKYTFFFQKNFPLIQKKKKTMNVGEEKLSYFSNGSFMKNWFKK